MYIADKERYNKMQYNRCGKSGLLLPALSLGLWHSFGDVNDCGNMKKLLETAFDNGITHFDLANNYGPPYGSAERNFGKIINNELKQYRDELIISTKAGYDMWEGPYGNFGSKKYLVASLNQSLKRMGLEYVDIFYHHRPDPDTPLEETLTTLDLLVRQGKALYIGISNYNAEQTKEAVKIFRELKTPFIIHQPSYSLFDRWIEDGLQELLSSEGIGTIAFMPLNQGMLTNKYLNGIPDNSRAAGVSIYLDKKDITEEKINKVSKLNEIALQRGQSLAQMALSWVLRDGKVTSALIGASRPEQIIENVKCLENLSFSKDELKIIDEIIGK